MNKGVPNHSAYEGAARLAIVQSVVQILWRSVAVVALTELSVMLLLEASGEPITIWTAMLDTVVLSAIALPILYAVILKPVARLAAERAAAAAESRFQAIAQAVQDGIVIFDARRNIQFANEGAELMHGYSRGSLHGMPMETIIPTDIKKLFRTSLEQFLTNGESPVIEKGITEQQGLRRNGEKFPIEISVSELVSEAEKRFVVVLRDITARKLMERLLRESEAQFRMIADSVPALLWMSGPEGQNTFANREALQFIGLSLEEACEAGWTAAIHPEDRERALELIHAAVNRKEAYELEFRILRADGEYRWFLNRGRPRCALDGSLEGYSGSCVDITERKHAEEEIRASEKRLREVFRDLPIAVRVIHEGRLLFVNPADAHLHGFTNVKEELTFGDVLAQITPDDRERVGEYYRRRAAGEDVPSEYEVRRLRRDGSTFPAQVHATRILYDGKPASLAVIQDLSERHRLQMYEQILPVCCVCGKIRNDEGVELGRGDWERLDQYVADHSDAQVSHTFCPECLVQFRKEQGI